MFERCELPSLWVARLTVDVRDTSEIAGVVGGLWDELRHRLEAAGVPVDGFGLRTFFGHPDGNRITVAAAYPVAGDRDLPDVEVVELPAVPDAAVVTVRAPREEVADAWRAFDAATTAHGLVPDGLHRQVLLATPDGEPWTVELQCPVREDASCAPT